MTLKQFRLEDSVYKWKASLPCPLCNATIKSPTLKKEMTEKIKSDPDNENSIIDSHCPYCGTPKNT